MKKQLRKRDAITAKRDGAKASETNPGPPGIAKPSMKRTRPVR